MKTINIPYKIFKDGISMADLTAYFYSDWEAVKFFEEATNNKLIVFKPIDENIGGVSKFFQVDRVENKTIRSIKVSECGGIVEIIHFKNQFLWKSLENKFYS